MRFILFTMLALLAACCGKNTQSTAYQRDPKWDLADEIYDNEIGKAVFGQLQKEKKLYACESGWGLRGKSKIRVMHCSFFYYNDIDLEEARELLVIATNLYLKKLMKINGFLLF